MRSSVILTSLFGIVHALPTKRADAVNDTQVLNFALTLEHLENTYYSQSLGKYSAADFQSAGLADWVRGRFEQIGSDEATHVAFLSSALGSDAVQACTYNFPDTDPKSFVDIADMLETIGASAYTGAASLLTNKDYLTAAAAILSVEARHAAWISSAVRMINPTNSPFETPLTPNQVLTLAGGLIVSCPGSNEPLPATAYPALTVPASAAPGGTVSLSWNATGNSSSTSYFGAFIQGIANTTYVPLGSDMSIQIPGDLRGSVFLVVTNQTGSTADNVTVAGPAYLNFGYDASGDLVNPSV